MNTSFDNGIVRALSEGQSRVENGTLAGVLASQLPLQNRLDVRQVCSSLSRNITLPQWAIETRRLIHSREHDMRIMWCSVDGVGQEVMTGRIMSASDLLDYVRSNLTNRATMYLHVTYAHAAMQRRLPDRISIRTHYSDDDDGGSSTLTVGYMDSLVAARYSRWQSQLLLDIDGNTPSWKGLREYRPDELGNKQN